MAYQDRIILALMAGYGCVAMAFSAMFEFNIIWHQIKHSYPINAKFMAFLFVFMTLAGILVPILIILAAIFIK